MATDIVPEILPAEMARRQARWHSFKVIFSIAYLGLVLDIVTTALGYHLAGKGYEQNPLGGTLIGGLGWWGLLFLLSGFAAVLFVSFKVVCFHMSSRVSGALTTVFAIATFVRWVAVVTAVLFIAQVGG